MHNPDFDSTFERALELERQGDLRAARDAFEECVALAPLDPRAHAHAGLANARIDDCARGLAHLRVAVAAAPQVAEGWMHLSSALHHIGRLDDAERAARQAATMKPALAGAWNMLGLVELDRRRYGEGRAHFRHALGLEPDYAVAHMNLGCCEHGLGRDAEAFESFRRALELDPRLAAAHYNMGALHHKQGRHAEALEHYREAIRLRPGDAQSHFNLALVLFITGRFEAAWTEYAWRSQRREYAPLLRREGNPRVAVLGEQGLGDVLFFLRFAAALRSRAGALEFVGDERLHPLLARTGLFAALAKRLDELPQAPRDVVLAGDLPLLVPGAAAATPPPLALAADPQRLAAMRARLSTFGPAPYVALAWRAGEPRSARIENLFKQVPLDALGTALRDTRATWIAIQRDPGAGEIDSLAHAIGAPVHDLTAMNADLEEAAALLAAVDDYVGVSSTLVHVRAGLRRGARVIVPFPHEWRWMESGDASPWFPDATVYRQKPGGDWREAFARLSADLATRR